MLSNSLFGRKNSTSSTYSKSVKINKKNHQPRHVAFEPLESRDLLTVTTGAIDDAAYDEIRAAYPDFNLPELQADLNVMTINPNGGALSLSDLQEALYAAGESSSPDLILVQTSASANTITYTSAADELAIDIDSGSVTIIGWGSDNLTLDANQQSRVMIISDSSTVNLGGLTITGGNSSASLMYSEIYGEYAGGIGSLGTLTISNCTITGNTASGYGGGIASSGTLTICDSLISNNTTTETDEHSGGGGIASSGTLTIINCEISNNEAASGAGIINSDGVLLIRETVISHNVATSEYSSGGGIVNSLGNLDIFNSVISNNSALVGGGVYNLGTVTVTKSEVINNTADGIGGGICNDYGTCMVISSTVSGNSSEECGGGIYCWWEDSYLTVMNSEISGNESAQGGGIFNKGVTYVYCSTISENDAEFGGGIYNSDSLTVTNSTIAGNALTESSDGEGAGIYSSGASAINNSIIVDAIYNDNEAGTITGSYNLSDYSGWSSDSCNIAYDSTQPLFVDAANGDYHLAAGSQAIDRGDNALAVDADGAALTNDQSGRLRINNDVVDIGAHEYKESISDYSAIRTKYAELELPESEYDVNIIVVDLTAGDGLAELHAAIATAGMTLQDDLIVVYTSDVANTLTYSDNEDALVIETDADDFGSVTLVSWGDSDLTIDANQVDSGIYVYGEYTVVNLGGLTFVNAYTGVYNEYGTVSVAQCEFSGNYTGIYNDYGVLSISNCAIKNSENNGILNYSGKLTVASSELSNNTGDRGGAICNDLGIVTITDSLISDNTAQDGGGAIYNGFGTLTVLNSEISDNKSNNMGGAIYNSHGMFTVLNSKISGNKSSMGGAIIGEGGTLTVMNSEISENIANYDGGGIYGYFEKVLLTNSVIAGNTAIYGGGSGIYAGSGSITVTNCTIAGNSSQYGGSGFYNAATTTINNSIIVDDIVNEDSYGIITGSNNLSAYSGWSDDSYNIAYDASQPLFLDADNGDYHLTDGALAIDAGNNDLAVDAKGDALVYDRDGAERISNGKVDIGAYEFVLDSSTLARPVLSTPIFEDDGSVTVSWSNVNNASGYLFEYKLTSDADWTSIDLTEQSFSLDLPDGQAYKVRVMAYSNGDYNNSEFSSEKLIFNYDDIREKYSTFDLPESKDNINIIVVDLTAGDNLAKLKKSVQKAVETAQEDLIVVLTSNDANTLKYTNSTDTLMFEDYSGTSYPITVISLGDSNLTIDANHLCRAIAVGSGIDVNLGGLTITNGYNSMDDGSAIANYGWLKISYCTITGNYTPNCGAILNGNDGGIIVTNSSISGNVSETSGGGIYNFGFTLVTNSVITDNSSNYGGGICNTSNLSVINSTIAANVAANEGAGIYNSGISLYADNSIIVDEIVNSYGDIAGNNNLSTFTGWTYGDDNLSYDPSKPLFVNAANGDYHLAAGSQATDNGNNDLALDLNGNALEFDLDGAARIVNGRVDIGAYEYQGEPIEYSTVVNTLNDSFNLNDDEWSLREAIYFAPDYVTITFADDLFADGPQTITLTQGELAIRKALVIDGDGLITIDANQASRVFNVTAGTEEQPVVLDGLTIQNGYTEELGGGIYTDGYLFVDNCVITGNSAMLGGGIATNSSETISQLIINNSIVSLNTSENSGGGIYSYGSLTITDSSISDNTTRGDYCDGGGIGYFINDPIVEATFTITNSSITGNTAYSGGGIRYSSNSDSNATFFTITDSVISGNSAKSEGGISCESAVLTVTNCDISDNTSDSGVGGGIAKFGGTLTVTNSTIVGNKAIEGSGGGICSYDAVVTITDSMITGNMALVGGGINTESGAVTIVGSVISENVSEDDGAGISSYCGSVTIISSAISGNTGSGVYCFDNTLTIIDSKITENTARYGAGIRIEDGGDTSIVNSLIADNIAENRGGAIYNHYGALTITNSTIAGNKVTCAGEHSDNDEYTEGGGIYNWGTVTINSYNSIIVCNTYCGADSDIYTSPVDSTEAVVNGYNTLSSFTAWDNAGDSVNWGYDSTQPLFVNAEKGIYRLADDSQAIDKGNNQYAIDAGLDESSKDLARRARFVGEAIDLGAYEYFLSSPIDFVGAVTTKINAYNDTNTIPDSAAQLTDWDQFYLELWAPDVSEFAPGDTFDAAVNYNPKYHQLDTAQTISTPDGVSAEIADQTIEGDGSVTVYITVTVSDSGYTAPGSNTYWGSVLFTPSTAQGAGVDDPFAQESLGISVDGVETETTLIAMPFDLDNDNAVDVDDFVAFAQVYGCRSGSFDIDDPRYAQSRQADFDNSGIVDVSDFVSFATNYGLKKGQDSNVQLPQQANALPGAPAQPVANEFVVEEQTAVQTPATTLQVEAVVTVVTQEASPEYLTLAQPAQAESVQTLHLAHSSALLDLFDNQNKPDAAVELSAPAIDNVLFDCDEFDFLFDDSDLDADDASDSTVDLSVVLDKLELEFA